MESSKRNEEYIKMILCETCLDTRKLLREATHEARGYECCVDCFYEMGV